MCVFFAPKCNLCLWHLDRDVIREANSLRVNIQDFSIKSLIGKGYFGDVHLSQEKSTNDLYAIKTIRKSQTVTSAQVKEERDIMAYKTSEWITSLQYAFQVRRTIHANEGRKVLIQTVNRITTTCTWSWNICPAVICSV